MPAVISDTKSHKPHDYLKSNIIILYATESGNSQDLANLLAVRLRRLTVSDANDESFKPIANIVVSSMDEYLVQFVDTLNTPADSSSFNLLFCLVSTTGQGEIPRTAARFWKFLLRKNLPKNLLKRFRFSTLGLGDSSYPRYNWAVRKFHARLLQLGAQDLADTKQTPIASGPNSNQDIKEPAVKRAEADEQDADHPPDQVFSEWQKEILGYLDSMKEFQQPDTGVGLLNDIPNDALLPPIDPITILGDQDVKDKKSTLDQALTRLPQDPPSIDANKLTSAVVSSITRTTSLSHFQDVRKITLDIPISDTQSESYMSYQPGDTIALYPSNDPDDVTDILEHLGWASVADKPIKVTDSFVQRILNDGVTSYAANSGATPTLVQPVTLRTLFTHHFDIKSVPRRTFFASICRFSILHEGDDPALSRERSKLEEFGFTTDEDLLQDLYNYANRPRRSIAETIQEFHTLGNKNVPVEYFAEIFPILRPRLFSIASADSGLVTLTTNIAKESVKVRRIELCVALVKYQTILRKIRVGTCSQWLNNVVAPAVEKNESQTECKVLISLQRNNLLKTARFPPDLDSALAQKNTTINHAPSALKKPQPLILVSTGTGVAPVRSLIQYYFDPLIEHYNKSMTKDAPGSEPPNFTNALENIPEIHLFFGTRNFAHDFHFKDYWHNLFSNPLVAKKLHMYCAFSRDKKEQETEPDTSLNSFIQFGKSFSFMTGVHIQAQIYAARTNLSKLLLEQDASIYICGAAGKFPVETRRTLVTALADVKHDKDGGESKQESEDWAAEIVKDMEQSGRIVQETW